jgi:hypothetical protein
VKLTGPILRDYWTDSQWGGKYFLHMTPEIIAPVALVLFGAVVIIYTQLIAPKMAQHRITLTLSRRGWMKIPQDRDLTWTGIMTFAIEGRQGASQVREYDRTVGPFTLRVKRTENRSGKTLELYQDSGASHPRYAALGIRKETILGSERSRFPLLGRNRKKFIPAVRCG